MIWKTSSSLILKYWNILCETTELWGNLNRDKQSEVIRVEDHVKFFYGVKLYGPVGHSSGELHLCTCTKYTGM